MSQRRSDELNLSLTGSQISSISSRPASARSNSGQLSKRANSLVDVRQKNVSFFYVYTMWIVLDFLFQWFPYTVEPCYSANFRALRKTALYQIPHYMKAYIHTLYMYMYIGVIRRVCVWHRPRHRSRRVCKTYDASSLSNLVREYVATNSLTYLH